LTDSRRNEQYPLMVSRTSLRASRLAQIQQMLQGADAVTIGQLTDQLGVSEATIRRDLDALQRSGLVQRTHGGAIATQASELPYPARNTRQVLEKKAIARVAATMVSAGDTVFIGGGSTTLRLAEALVDVAITVVTNSIPVATELSRGRHGQVIVVGGSVRTPELSLVGPRAVDGIRSYRATIAFLGVPALDSEHGFTADGDVEAATDSAFIDMAQHTVVLADHTKLGRVSTRRVVPLEALHTVITDPGATPSVIDELRAAGTQVIVAELSP
jgi:DeoR family transcriptional regulator of aga operon